ncbi:cobalamin biosynthesis protein CobG [Embleya sp. NBC_00888]|uniref:cobalamin biosynthesis protein CobG n=1 Tax=Embleya sp. NBC_00888 TaxID=2975960 RepID=UPI003864E573|nr:cobalamin biosynthesis protein CobG [Embleya sp. NBC_00888]
MGAVVVRERDDACPGVVDASPADDGLIARVRLPGGRLTPAQLHELAELAGRFGTGSIDLTARANIQLRGLAEADLPALAEAVTAAGLMPSRSHDRVRNILAGPLAGRDPNALLDADAVLTAVDHALCAAPDLSALSGRFLIGIDDGGIPIASARHDLDLVAPARDTFALHAAGHDTTWRFAPADAPAAIVHAARAFLAARADTGAWHIRELPSGAARFAAALGAAPFPRPTGGPAAAGPSPAGPHRRSGSRPPIGVLPQSDGRFAVGALVPLGRLTRRHLSALVGLRAELRITGTRGVVIRDMTDPAATSAALEAAGLPCDPASPWRGVTACSGLGACRRALADVRTEATRHALGRSLIGAALADTTPMDADRPAADRPGALGRADTHWVGCARACGKPAGATLVVAREDGTYETVPPGRAPTPGPGPARAPAPGPPAPSTPA